MERQYVEIAFRQAGELFLFDAGELSLKADDRVVVDTEHGQAIGTVKSVQDSAEAPPNNFQLYRVVRMASSEDIGREQRHKRKEQEAFEYCSQKIGELDLPMKLIQAEYFFSGSKLLFYFSAEGRVDFRTLVRDLARYFQKRIEMRQIGVRDSAKLIGGVGPCGQQLCCNRFLRQFNPVSIRMAKDQSLPLNPQKVSGVCGRLMCCLAYEQGMYQTLRKRLPRIGEDIETSKGKGKVRDVHPLQETVRVVFFQNEPPTEEEFHVNDLPEFRDIPVPEQMPLNMSGKPDKSGRGRRRSRRGLEPLMEPRQPGRSTSGAGDDDNFSSRDNGPNDRSSRDDRNSSRDDDRGSSRDDRGSSRDDRSSSRDDRNSSRDDRNSSRDDRNSSRSARQGRKRKAPRESLPRENSPRTRSAEHRRANDPAQSHPKDEPPEVAGSSTQPEVQLSTRAPAAKTNEAHEQLTATSSKQEPPAGQQPPGERTPRDVQSEDKVQDAASSRPLAQISSEAREAQAATPRVSAPASPAPAQGAETHQGPEAPTAQGAVTDALLTQSLGTNLANVARSQEGKQNKQKPSGGSKRPPRKRNKKRKGKGKGPTQ